MLTKRRIWIAWRALTLVAVLGSGVAAAGKPVTVYPTGVFSTDVFNVQRAIDGGGTVLLKATDASNAPRAFNFGAPVAGSGFVVLHHDVQLIGETVDDHITTIAGGNSPIRVFDPIHFTVHGIRFDGPRLTAINVFASAQAEISSNRITDVVPLSSGVGTGIRIQVPQDSPGVTGTLVIADNVIQRVYGNFGAGIQVANHRAVTSITGNYVSDVDWNGIIVGVFDEPQTIADNTVIPGPGVAEFATGNGIAVGHTRGGSAYIHRNTVLCENPFADGILILAGGSSPLPADDFVIANNDVTMLGSVFGAISLVGTVNRNMVRNNRVTGDGAFALDVTRYTEGDLIAADNSFIGNNIVGFESELADLFLDVNAYRTIANGYHGSVVDLGTENWISGFSRKLFDANLGQRMREAQERKKQLLAPSSSDEEFVAREE